GQRGGGQRGAEPPARGRRASHARPALARRAEPTAGFRRRAQRAGALRPGGAARGPGPANPARPRPAQPGGSGRPLDLLALRAVDCQSRSADQPARKHMEPRKQEILRAVIREFTSSALPVGSQVLVSRHFVNLSSATVRGELSELSDLGYLVQPHTSAGRIPTDRGYRYFVDFLMDPQPVPLDVESFIEGELRFAPADPQALVEKVATTTAAVTQNAAVVSSPHGPQARLKHVDLVSLEPTEVLVILLVEGNLLRQQVLSLGQLTTQAELSRLANKFNRELGGKDRDALM